MSQYDDVFGQLTEAEKADLLATYAARNPATATLLSIESFADLVAQELQPQQFLIEGLLPTGQLVMLGGRGKAGKSWLVLQAIAAIDRGIQFLGKTTRQGRVLYLALEDGRRRMNQRPKTMKWRPSPSVEIAFRVGHFDRGGDGLSQIRQAIADKGYDLVVIDTLVATLSSAADENSNTEMGAICNALADLAHDSGATILVVHHTSKVTTENPFDNLRGASAIRNAYDVGMLLRRAHNQREATLYVESRDFDADDMTIKQADNGAGWEYLGDASVGVSLAAGRIGVADLIAAGDGATTQEIAEAVNKSAQSVRGTMNTAAKHFLVVNKPDKTASKGSKAVDRWYLTLDAQMAAHQQGENDAGKE